MSALLQPDAPLTEADYLAFERASQDKHQFVDGEIVAMTGASRNHNLILVGTLAALLRQLSGRGCEVYPSDMRVAIPARHSFVYPDAAVVCGEPQLTDDHFDTLLNPTLIVEVLSPTTEAYDRGDKLHLYRELPSVQEVLLIAQNVRRLESFRREAADRWLLTIAHGPGAALALTSINATLALDEVYAQVRFPTDADEASR